MGVSKYGYTVLIEDTVEEPMPFKSLMDAARYLYDSDMSPNKPSKISIYTSLVYAVKHNNRYKNYRVLINKPKYTQSNDVEIKITTDYIPEKDVTVVWQHINIPASDFQQIALVGWYCGEPDANLTEVNSSTPLIATLP